VGPLDDPVERDVGRVDDLRHAGQASMDWSRS
jgi:hypothetical protein